MSGFYVLPVGVRPMSSWSSHQRRVPKSTEPGTDFYCPIGTPVKAPEAGRIYAVGDSITPASGRWVGIDFDDGRRFRVLHLQRRTVSPGQRVSRSQIIGYSGASGYGKEDWSNDPNTGGAHVHVTLWPTQSMLFGYRTIDGKSVPYTIDFYVHAALGDTAGGGSTPFDPEEDDDMSAAAEQMIQQIHSKLFNGTPEDPAHAMIDQLYVQSLDTNNKLSIEGAAYGRPQVIQQRAEEIHDKLETGAGYDWLPAIANQGNAILAALGSFNAKTAAPADVEALAAVLREGLGDEIANALADALAERLAS